MTTTQHTAAIAFDRLNVRAQILVSRLLDGGSPARIARARSLVLYCLTAPNAALVLAALGA